MITEQCLIQLGFVRQQDWILTLPPNDGWLTRLVVLACKEPLQVFLEQPEFTGAASDGTGDSDWDWEDSNCVTINCDDDGLRRLVAILREQHKCSGTSTKTSNYTRSACSLTRIWSAWKWTKKLWRCCTGTSMSVS